MTDTAQRASLPKGPPMMSRARWHARAAALVLVWLVAAGVVSLVHRQVPASDWLRVHMVVLGAVSNALLIWTVHFAQTLLRRPDPPNRRAETLRLAGFNVGALTAMAGMVAGQVAVVSVGGVLAAAAVIAHTAALVRAARRALPSRFAVTVRYYLAAALFAVLTFALGIGLARGDLGGGDLGGTDESGSIVAHATLGLLGWIGLPILGTLVTLWPTMLRTRIAAGAERRARQALPGLVLGTLVAAGGLLVGHTLAAAAGVLVFLVAGAWTVSPMVVETRQRPPASFATWSTLAGVVWVAVALAAFGFALVRSGDSEALAATAGRLTAAAVVGGVLQVLLGSLAYLIPVMTGGGPAAVRVRNERADRGRTARLLVTNLGLAVCVLPSPSAVRVTGSVAVLGALVASVAATISSMRPTPEPDPDRPRTHPSPAGPGAGASTDSGVGWVARQGAGIAAGLGIVLLAVVAGVAVDPAALGSGAVDVASAEAGVTPTGHTTHAEIHVVGMRFSPATISVPAGDDLVITVTNTGTDIHDLAIETGQRTPRLHPGESATLDVGVVGRSLAGWCTVAGHRQMGMVLAIDAVGGTAGTPAGTGAGSSAGDHGMHAGGSGAAGSSGSTPIDLMADPGPGFTPYDPRLAPAPKQRVHRVRLPVTEQVTEVAPGVRQMRWTFGGTAPGPVLRGKVGDDFVVTLVNEGSIGHSIDFHAGTLAPDQPMRTIAPGEELEYRFTATRAGIWMYHCSTMPMSMHIANGLFGAVIIDPPDLPAVDREFVLVQSEEYLGADGGTADADALAAGDADLVVFNGYPMQYDHHPLTVGVGERIRIWLLDAGPNRSGSFHVVGGQFDTVYREGAFDLRRGEGDGGSQALGLFPAQGGYVELTLPEAGHYPFVSHIMSDAERGAHGILLAK